MSEEGLEKQEKFSDSSATVLFNLRNQSQRDPTKELSLFLPTILNQRYGHNLLNDIMLTLCSKSVGLVIILLLNF